MQTAEMVPAAEPKKRTLYDISDDYADLAALMESIDGEILPEHEEQLDAFIKDLDVERDLKLDAYGGYIRDIETLGKARDEEAKRIAGLARTDLNKAKYLKTRLHGFFMLHGLKKVETLRFRFSRVRNGGKRPVMLDREAEDHPEELPEHYRRVRYEPDLDRIREDLETLEALRAALEAGNPIGDEDNHRRQIEDLEKELNFARLDDRGEHMRIG